jgi:hypothetical protein
MILRLRLARLGNGEEVQRFPDTNLTLHFSLKFAASRLCGFDIDQIAQTPFGSHFVKSDGHNAKWGLLLFEVTSKL